MNSCISGSRRHSEPQVGLADGLVVVELLGRALHGDAPGLEHVAPVADVEGQVGVLLDDEDGEPSSRLRSPRRAKSSRVTSGARPNDGSSRSSRRGRAIIARARASICCSPPLMLPASCRRRSPRRGNTSYQRARSRSTSLSRRLMAPMRRFSSTVRSVKVPRALRDVGDAQAGHRLGPLPRDGGAVEADLPRHRDLPADGPQGGGLAGAVGAQDDGDVALVDGEVDVVEHLDRPVAAGHVVQFEQAHAGARGRPRSPWGRCAPRRAGPRRSCDRSRGRRCGRRSPSPWPCGARPAGS